MNSNTPSNHQPVNITNIAQSRKEGRLLCPDDRYLVEVLDQNWESSLVEIDDPVPTGRQILAAANKTPVENYLLLLKDHKGVLKVVNLDESVDVYQQGVEQFIAFDNDRLFYVSLNGQRFPWGQALIRENVLRKIGEISSDHEIWLERRNVPDKLLGYGESVDLEELGLEKLYSQPKCWELNVQGVMVSSKQPTIVAKDAIKAAGFNPNNGWILILKIKGEPKQRICLEDIIDLRKDGIEKLRLTPAEINNGEIASATSLEFALLEHDMIYLNQLGLNWESRLVGGRRWLVVHNYILPGGYSHEKIDIAIDIPTAYPDAQLDMFFVSPPLTLANGQGISQTESRENILGNVFQRWSRHLNGTTRWDPLTDSVKTHLAVVEESLLREVGL